MFRSTHLYPEINLFRDYETLKGQRIALFQALEVSRNRISEGNSAYAIPLEGNHLGLKGVYSCSLYGGVSSLVDVIMWRDSAAFVACFLVGGAKNTGRHGGAGVSTLESIEPFIILPIIGLRESAPTDHTSSKSVAWLLPI